MKPLAGLRIADFSVHAAGPFCTHVLSQLGAECIKIESALRPDIFRRPHPVYGREGPASFDQVASNKLSVRLNLKHPAGVELSKRLVAISDVAAESFRPGVMDRLGLGYAVLSSVKPDLVMVSISASGQSGPDSNFAGYAPLFGAWGGLGYLTGYRDGPPVEMRHAMDHSVGLNAALATMAALHERRRSGKGSYVDVAAREVATSAIGEALLQAGARDTPERMGNEDFFMAPHGVYPTQEPDRWLTVAVGSASEWQGLLTALDKRGQESDPQLATPELRHAHRHRLDAMVAAWTVTMNAEEAASTLQNAGVPAHVSWTAKDITADAHMRHRGAIVQVEEPGGSERAAVRVPMRFSEYPEVGIERGTPALGEHESYVFGELLGIGRTEYNSLVEDRVIY